MNQKDWTTIYQNFRLCDGSVTISRAVKAERYRRLGHVQRMSKQRNERSANCRRGRYEGKSSAKENLVADSKRELKANEKK